MPRDKNIFTLNPTSLDMPRSVFNRNSQLKTSFNLGKIVPIYCDEILPGDTVSMDLAEVIRTSSPFVAPIMDNIHADVYFFFVPNRLLWEHWQQFNGENDTAAWTEVNSYTIPVQDIGASGTPVGVGSLGDYFGLPIKDDHTKTGLSLKAKLEVSELPLRAYWKIYNDWFMDENNVGPRVYTIGDTANTAITYSEAPAKAARFHDLFSSCLPGPQKGASVVIPLGTSAPIIGDGSRMHSTIDAIKFGNSTQIICDTDQTFMPAGFFANEDSAKDAFFGFDTNNDMTSGDVHGINRTNLVADLRNATAATINALRTAFQVQKLLERDARGGTRYVELLRAHFGVTSPDARLQRAEYLAGQRFRINVDQVVATADSGSSGSSVVGEVGAMSRTSGAGSMFTKSFVEHGLLIGVVVLRQDHTYSQGLEKYFKKSERFDFYYPVLANIGEVPVKKMELDAYSHTVGGVLKEMDESAVFGYQEAWYEYRFRPSRCTGYLNPVINGALDQWTLADYYEGGSNTPGLNANFIEETSIFLDRALTVASSTMHSFIADFYFKAKYSRVMPLYSIPGLIDHH